MRDLERLRARGRAWRAAHPEVKRAWEAANVERVRANRRAWRKAHPESGRAWSRAHAEERRAAWRAWRKANLPHVRERKRRRGAAPTLRWLLRKRPTLSPICAIGGGTAHHADHILPVSRGGTNALDNLRPLCARHNVARGAGRFSDEQLREIPCGFYGAGL